MTTFPSFGMTVMCASSNLWKESLDKEKELKAFKNGVVSEPANVLK